MRMFTRCLVAHVADGSRIKFEGMSYARNNFGLGCSFKIEVSPNGNRNCHCFGQMNDNDAAGVSSSWSSDCRSSSK